MKLFKLSPLALAVAFSFGAHAQSTDVHVDLLSPDPAGHYTSNNEVLQGIHITEWGGDNSLTKQTLIGATIVNSVDKDGVNSFTGTQSIGIFKKDGKYDKVSDLPLDTGIKISDGSIDIKGNTSVSGTIKANSVETNGDIISGNTVHSRNVHTENVSAKIATVETADIGLLRMTDADRHESVVPIVGIKDSSNKDGKYLTTETYVKQEVQSAINSSNAYTDDKIKPLNEKTKHMSSSDDNTHFNQNVSVEGDINANNVIVKGVVISDRVKINVLEMKDADDGRDVIFTGVKDNRSRTGFDLATSAYVDQEVQTAKVEVKAYTDQEVNSARYDFAQALQAESNASRAYTNQKFEEAVKSANSYTDKQIAMVDKKAKGYSASVGAGVLAVASAPAEGGLGASIYTVGGEQAIAVGARIAVTNNLNLNATVSHASSGTTGGVGVGYKW